VQSVADRLRACLDGLPVEQAMAVPILGSVALDPVLIRVGSARSVRVEPVDVLRPAVVVGARHVVVAHNHVADVGVSEADRAVTRRLVAAGSILGVRLRAHLVLTPERWFDALEPNEVGRSYGSRGAAAGYGQGAGKVGM
jgi:DNA repair protein RadC